MEEERYPTSRSPSQLPAAGASAAAICSISAYRGPLPGHAPGAGGGALMLRLYKEVLAELTFNSKPVITELAAIAGQHIQFAEGIADAICSGILELAYPRRSVKYTVRSIRVSILQCAISLGLGHKYFLIRYFARFRMNSTYLLLKDRAMGNANQRNSESLSPHPSHGIHVNPKYLESRRQLEMMFLVSSHGNSR